MMKTLLATATLAVLAAPALAQPPADTAKPTTTEDAFMKHDMNKDGALSLSEVQMADKSVTQADFDKYDADKSKTLSKTEFSKWAEAKSTPPASTPG
jgi:hypothetical protein